MSESTVLTVRAKPADLQKVELILGEFAEAGGISDGGHFGRAFRMSAAIRHLHMAITDDMMKDIMHLQGTALGFLTDKDDPMKNNPPGYPVGEVKLVAIEAALMGAYWVGNEFNIISGRPYLTKNFFTRKLREMPGFTDLKLSPGVPVMVGEKGALVPYIATWKFNGEPMRIERLVTKIDDKRDLDERICVKVNSGMGADAILGKAERKIKAAIYARLTGSDLTAGEVDDAEGIAKPVRGMDDLAAKLQRGGNGNGNGHSTADAGERPQTTAEVDTERLDFARMVIAGAKDAVEVEFETDQVLAKGGLNEPTIAAIKGLATARKQAIADADKPKGGKQKELVK